MKYLSIQDINLDALGRDELEQYVRIMADDLINIVSHHTANCRMSERDMDDIQSLLVDLCKPYSRKELI